MAGPISWNVLPVDEVFLLQFGHVCLKHICLVWLIHDRAHTFEFALYIINMCLDLEGTEDGSRNGWTTGHVGLLKRNTRHGKGILILRNIRAMLISNESATRLQLS